MIMIVKYGVVRFWLLYAVQPVCRRFQRKLVFPDQPVSPIQLLWWRRLGLTQ